MKFLLSVLLLLFCANTMAQCLESDTTLTEQQIANNDCTLVGQWDFSLGFGWGKHTNPLYDGKDTPLYVVPSLRYYGEKLYFDDGVLGYTFFDSPNISISVIAQLNGHAASFYRWHPSNIVLSNRQLASSAEALDSRYTEGFTGPERKISINDVSKRRWAADAGVQFNYFFNDDLMLQANILRDISAVYHGYNGQIQLNKSFRFVAVNRFLFKLSGGIDWSQGKLLNYYYGVSNKDTHDSSIMYKASSGYNWFIKTSASYRLTEQWRGVMTYNKTKLNSSISNSPLVEQDSVDTMFVGMIYDF